jgi:thiol-disulfide isomerase/thioredoxin
MTNFCDECLTVIMFKADWCGHCKTMFPIFEKVAEKMEARKIAHTFVFEQTDPKHTKVMSQFNIKGYPTILVYKCNQDKYVQYTGPKSVEKLTEFIMKHYDEPNETSVTGFEESIYNVQF